jgi:hypothetical protein
VFAHAHADVENQKPFKHDHRNATAYRVAALHCGLRMPLYGVLKETAHEGEAYKNSNKNNRMPRWGDERAARRVRSKVASAVSASGTA